MYKIRITVLFFFVFIASFNGQVNLVSNGSFESYTSCPTFGAQWNKCVGWNNVNMNIGVGSWGTPDYFNACGSGGTQPPSTFAGTCAAHTGGAMMALVLYHQNISNFREYLSTHLTCPMNPGTTYTLSFWLSNGTGVISPWTIKNIGVFFSANALSQSGWNLISVTPQCEIQTNVMSTGWTQYTFTVNPTVAWNYLTIGCFRSDANNNAMVSFPNPGGNGAAYANYFIDDIEVWSPDNSISISSSTGSFTMCAGASITLSTSATSSYTWSNGVTNAPIVVSPTLTNSYTITTPGSCGNILKTITVSVTTVPTLAISGPTNVCSGQTLQLSGSGASTYTWSTGVVNAPILLNPTVTNTYSLTTANVCGSAVTSVTVSVMPLPTLTISGPTNICTGQTLQLTAGGANTYTWNNTSAFQTFTANPTVSNTYTLSGTNSSGCVSTISVGITVSNLPNISVAGNFTICKGGKAILTASGASTYTWNTNAVVPTITVSPSTSQNYTVTGTANSTNCSNHTVATVYMSDCVSQVEMAVEKRINVFPQPFTDRVNLEATGSEIGTIFIYDALGRLLYSKTFDLAGISSYEPDLGFLACGSYLLVVRGKDGSRGVARLIKD